MEHIKSLKNFSINEDEMKINPSTAGENLGAILAANKDVVETPENKGPEVEKYLSSVGLKSGQPWCMAFVYYVFNELAKKMGKTNPLPKTGGVLDHWKKADNSLKTEATSAVSNPSLVKPGQIFFMSTGGGYGHTGIVIAVNEKDKSYTSIEGNSNDTGGREGRKVAIVNRSLNDKKLMGFVDYFKSSRTPEFEGDLKKSLELPESIKSKISSGNTTSNAPEESDPGLSFAGSILSGLIGTLRPNSGLDGSSMVSFLKGKTDSGPEEDQE